ncbi:MAG TPA: SpoIIE family protein phosphatase [Noviherbaspirillum sp.]|uniref:SpoIIE family protein phosphatase n=1 Tax=Noviherbaspirillum sp. TaxID=1926288 RepID=UPI002B49B6F9|nr:SpoIIE family protein phosphatase [Noviherbaspirillum sp.]HJV87486.1 SpoIIE family protein phosphatase [Noviherbaspirillum sp.]
MISTGSTPLLHYWVAGRPKPGERESGDKFVIAPRQHGVLVAVIDGLGHGEEACVAAELAAATLTTHADEPLLPLIQRCHQELRRERGVVMTVASFDTVTSSMTWLGIGNVDAMLLRAAEPGGKPVAILPRGGIVGDRLPALAPVTLPVYPGDFLILATDGIGSAFVHDLRRAEQPQQLVNQIFYAHARNTDDALVLGVQWTGANRESTNARN